jgi:hypothetical protein
LGVLGLAGLDGSSPSLSRLDVVRLDKRTLIKFSSLEQLLSPDPDAQLAPRKTPRRRRVRPAEGAEAK